MKYKYTLILFVFLSACYPKYYSHLKDYNQTNKSLTTDYSNLYNWAAHPDKKDPSDSIPSLLLDYKKENSVDVFFIHPTTFTDKKNTKLTNASIGNDSINATTDYGSILYQASAFNCDAKIYAPRYRQAYIGMYYTTDTLKAINAFDTAYSDVKAAFIYYLEHNNNNRPIVIASHSQGSTHAKRLLKEFFDNKPLQNKLVTAYLIGMPIKEKEFEQIPVCTDSTKTGCFVSWRTYRIGVEIPQKTNDKIAVVNPLSWKYDEEYISSKSNNGGILFNYNRKIPNITDAQVHNNILWINKPKFFGSALFNPTNYHVADYNLFYYNIRADIRRRIKYYNLHTSKP
jgi:hypothetical protein